MRSIAYVVVTWGMGLLSAQAADRDLVLADFEGADYGSWTAEGEAFGIGPAQGTLPGQMTVTGFVGKGLVNTFLNGDGATGTLTSPEFTIVRKYISFLIGGGGHEGKTCMELRIDGQVVRSATGTNVEPGGTEHLEWAFWDVTEFTGKQARICIVDAATGGWGHLNVDEIRQTDTAPPTLGQKTRDLTIESAYLHFPVKSGARKVHLTVETEGRVLHGFDIEFGEEEVDFWSFLDVRDLKGQTVTVRADKVMEASTCLEKIEQSDELKSAEDLYREAARPQFHFTARRGWLNDPNGLVYHDGEYHLFFQHNPYGWSWGNMHWGHAVSTDLVHWRELPIALYPDASGTMFSGSAVVDTENTAGFNREGIPALIAIYTAAGDVSVESKGRPFTQCMAYSTDRGRSFTKYAGNPILPHIVGGNRDPKVIRYAPDGRWIMALYLDKEDFALFESSDLGSWKKLCDVHLPGSSECPEFFEIPVEGVPGETRWVFYGGNGRYLVGRFDGKRFAPESGPHELNRGNCFYASQTFNDLPSSDGRRIQIAWGQMNFPGMPFNQMMGFPVELTLHDTTDGLRLQALPVREIAHLRTASQTWKEVPLPAGEPLADRLSQLFELDTEIALESSRRVTLAVRGVPVTYDVERNELTCLDKASKMEPVHGIIRLRVLVDRASIDIFGNGGAVYMPMGVMVPQEGDVSLTSEGGDAHVRQLTVHTLKSAWFQQPS